MTNRAFIVCGLAYGDEGKGTITDYLCRREKANLVVRFNGGAQAGHNVVTNDGKHHTFSQFGSGTFAGVPTFLSRYMVVNPIFMLSEATALKKKGISNPFSMMNISQNALVTTPFHVSMNRIREIARGKNRHGSCGMGVGETVVEDKTYFGSVRMEDLVNTKNLKEKLQKLQKRYANELENFNSCSDVLGGEDYNIIKSEDTVEETLQYFTKFVETGVKIVEGVCFLYDKMNTGTVVFEGAQGVLLDQKYGFHPYSTWSNCTFRNAESLIEDIYENKSGGTAYIKKIGVLRKYLTRHGVGPLPTEYGAHTNNSGEHNKKNDWQGYFRYGHFDWVTLKYALNVCKREVDELALTHCDQLGGCTQSIAVRYGNKLEIAVKDHDSMIERTVTPELMKAKPHYVKMDLNEFLEAFVSVPVGIRSYGPTAEEKESTNLR